MNDLFSIPPPSDVASSSAHQLREALSAKFYHPCVPGGVRDTSIAAYREHQGSGKLTEQQEQLVYFLRFKPEGVTRNELAQGTTLRLSSVCGRVNELIKLNVLSDGPRRKCTVTGINSHVVTLTPKP